MVSMPFILLGGDALVELYGEYLVKYMIAHCADMYTTEAFVSSPDFTPARTQTHLEIFASA